MKKLLAVTFSISMLSACTQQSEPQSAREVSAELYETAVMQNSADVAPIKRTDAQNDFIRDVMDPACLELAATQDGCDDYKQYIEQAQALHQKALQKLDSSDPQVYRPFRYIFKKACQCNDPATAEPAAHQLIAIQSKLFGVKNIEVCITIADLANLYLKQKDPQKALALVDGQLNQFGDMSRLDRRYLHGIYHLLVEKIKAEDALGNPDETIKTCSLAMNVHKHFITGKCWDFSRDFVEAHVASAKAQQHDLRKAVLLFTDAVHRRPRRADETDDICQVGTRIENQLIATGQTDAAKTIARSMAQATGN